MRGARRCFDRLGRNRVDAIRNVVGDRVVEQHRLLRDYADLMAERLQAHVAYVDPVDQDRAAGNVVKARQQVDQRRLARTAQADNRNDLTRARAEADVLQHCLPRPLVVSEAHISELDAARMKRQCRRAGPRDNFGVRVEDLEDAGCRRHRLLEVGVHAAETLDRRVQEEGRRDERQKVAGGRGTLRDFLPPVPQQPDHRDAAEEFHDRWKERDRAGDLEIRAIQPLGRSSEAPGLMPLRAECLDDAMSRERLSGEVRQVFEMFLAAPGRAPHTLAEPHQRINHDRRADHRDERQPPFEPEHQRDIADGRQPLAQQIADRLGHRLLDLADVVGDARHQLACRAPAEECGGLVEDVAEEPVADIPDYPLPDVRHQVRRKVRSDALRQIGHDDRRGPEGERAVVVVRQDLVDDWLDQEGDAGARGGINQHRGQREGEARAVRP